MEGKYIDRDVNEAIRLYKEASCFNIYEAKNNLGVIYKEGYGNVEKNISLAKEYFKEGIQNGDDFCSIYNYVNLLLDEDESIDNIVESINMLSMMSDEHHAISESFSNILLVVYHDTIKDSYEKINIRNENPKNYFTKDELNAIIITYDKLRKVFFLFGPKNIIMFDQLNAIQKYKTPIIKDINNLFYEGLGNI